MDVRLSPEQEALRDSVVQVVGHHGPSAVGQLDDGERSAKLDAAVEAAGWRGLRSPDGSGRPWASGVEVALVAEELGRGLADTAFLGPTLAADLRRRAGAPDADRPETVLLTPDLGALAVCAAGSRAVEGIALDVSGAARALTLITAGEGWELGSVALEPIGDGVDLTRATAMPAGEAGADPVPGQQRPLDREACSGFAALAVTTTCADLVGVMRGATELATAYARERRQYGAPIGSFQAVQHLLADAAVATEGARSITLYAAWAADALPPAEAEVAAAVAKAYASRAALAVCETAIQVHGGIGNTWDCLAHVYLRRALLSTDAFGGLDASLGHVIEAQLGGDRGLR